MGKLYYAMPYVLNGRSSAMHSNVYQPNDRTRVDTVRENERMEERVAARVCWCMSKNAMLQIPNACRTIQASLCVARKRGDTIVSVCRLHSCARSLSRSLCYCCCTTYKPLRTALYRTATAILTLVLFQVSAIHVVYPVNDEG